MASFATPADLATYLGREELEDVEFLQAQLLLDMASDEIRRWTRQTINYVPADTVDLTGTYLGTLVLPERPVVAVSAVAVNGGSALVADVDYSFTPDGGLHVGAPFEGWASPMQGGRAGCAATWGGPGSTVTVTYSHGFVVVPSSVKMATLAMVARVMVSPSGVRQETIAGYSVTYADASAAVRLESSEVGILSWLRRRSL